MDWKKGLELAAHMVTAAAAAGGLVLVGRQMGQANEHQRLGNYNQLNQHYSALYREIPPELHFSSCRRFDTLDEKSKNWARSYFDLYSEEHWLYLEGLIPSEMWTKRIDGGVDVNLKTYTALVQGYEYWRDRGAFRHPSEFIPLVDAKIRSLKRDVDAATALGCEESRRLLHAVAPAAAEVAGDRSGADSPRATRPSSGRGTGARPKSGPSTPIDK